MTRHILLAIALLAASVRVEAGLFTDIWYKSTEPGWGVNLVQTDDFIFATFFVYGSDGTPTWVVANLQWNGVDSYAGDLFATHGTFFGVPWDPTASAEAKVGTASFKPSPDNAYQGTLTYTVTSTLSAHKALAIGTATNQIERQNLLAPSLNGSYRGRQIGTYSGCTNANDNHGYTDEFSLTVEQFADNSATFAFDYGDVSCTFAGTLAQNGLLYRAPLTYKCTGNFVLDATATMTGIKKTSQGIEGTLFAASAGAGCAESARFSAVKQ